MCREREEWRAEGKSEIRSRSEAECACVREAFDGDTWCVAGNLCEELCASADSMCYLRVDQQLQNPLVLRISLGSSTIARVALFGCFVVLKRCRTHHLEAGKPVRVNRNGYLSP